MCDRFRREGKLKFISALFCRADACIRRASTKQSVSDCGRNLTILRCVYRSIIQTARREHAPALQRMVRIRYVFPKKYQMPIYIFRDLCIMNREQSRRPCVKCRWDGELPDGRRKCFSTMGSPHPLLHIGYPPLCSNDTRSGEWLAVWICCLSREESVICKRLPGASAPGIFAFAAPGAAAVVIAYITRRHFL